MRRNTLSLAMLTAFAMAAPAALYAQTTSNDDPNKQPPAGERIPASPGNPQHSGDISSDAKDQPGTAANRTGSQSTGTSSSPSPSSGPTPSGAVSGGSRSDQTDLSQPSDSSSGAVYQSGQGGTNAARSATGAGEVGRNLPQGGEDHLSAQSGAQRSNMMNRMGPGNMHRRSGGSMSGQDMSDPYSSQDQGQYDPRADAWRRWHEQMAQQGWMNDQGRMPGNRSARGNDDWSPGQRYSDQGNAYWDRSGNYPNQGRWNQPRQFDNPNWGAMGQGPDFGGRDYYSGPGQWSGQRYGRSNTDQGWGWGGRDDYYADRGPQWQGQGRRDWMGRGPSFDDNYYDQPDRYRNGPPDWRMQDRWRMQGQQRNWSGDMADRGGRWHGDSWRDGSAMGDMWDRGSQPYYGGDYRGAPDYGSGSAQMRGGRWQGGQWQGDPWQGGRQWQQQGMNDQWDRYGANDYNVQGGWQPGMEQPGDMRGTFQGRGQRFIPRQAQITGARSPLAPNMEGDYRNLPGTSETVTGQHAGDNSAGSTARSESTGSSNDQRGVTSYETVGGAGGGNAAGSSSSGTAR